MPGRDGTGPLGAGSMTGRRMGHCANVLVTNYPGFTCRGTGRGMGRGYRWRFFQSLVPENIFRGLGGLSEEIQEKSEAKYLKNQIQSLQNELDFLKDRLTKIETSEEK